jgi:hypothetical protein
MGGDASMVAIDTSAVTDLVLVRLSGEAGGRLALGRLTRALEPYVAHRLSHSQWRELLDEVLGNLVARQLIVCDGARVALTGVGWTRSWRMFAWPVPRSARWPELRDVHLLGKALGLVGHPRGLKSLATVSGLRLAVLSKACGERFATFKSFSRFKMKLTTAIERISSAAAQFPARLRQLAKRMLELAVARKAKVPSQRSQAARLASELIGSPATSLAAMRLRILRCFATGERAIAWPSQSDQVQPNQVQPDHVRQRPLPDTMLDEVRRLAMGRSQGWAGNRRALIAEVWEAVRGTHPDWIYDLAEFKSLLLSAHRAGQISLAFADIRGKNTSDKLQASAIAHGNMVWHFIRVEEDQRHAA